MELEELQAKVGGVKRWFHSIALPQGITTPGMGALEPLLATAEIYFAMGVQGRSVLDIGAWDGFFSFEAERRGAADVLAVDDFVWRPDGPGDRRAFEIAREALGSRVRDRVLDLPQTNVEQVGEFDIVLYNGIVYHALDPVHDLIETAQIARHVLSVETWIDNLETPRAVMNYFGAEPQPHGYPTTGWGPNSLLMHALLKRIGFETVLEFATPGLEAMRSIFLAFKPGHPFADFVAAHPDQARPRFTGNAALREPAALLAELESLRAEVVEQRKELAALGEEVAALRSLPDAPRGGLGGLLRRGSSGG